MNLHAMFAGGRRFWRQILWIVLGTAIACSTSVPYIVQVSRTSLEKMHAGRDDAAPSGEKSIIEEYRDSIRPGWIAVASYAFRGATLLTAEQRFYGLSTHRLVRVYEKINRVSRAAHLWIGVGILVTIVGCFRYRRDDLKMSLARLALLTLLFHAAVLAWADVAWFEHYLVGVFAHTVLLCWIGVQIFWAHRIGRWLLVVLPATASIVATFMLIGIIHERDGGQNQYGHTVGNFMQIVQALENHHTDDAYTDCPEMLARRWTLADLRWICAGAPPAQPPGEPGLPRLMLRRAFPGDAHLEVRWDGPTEQLFHIDAWPG